MVAVVFLHMCRVFLTGAYKPPREFNWVIGVLLLLVTFFLSFTGYLLPWDQLAFWAITVGTSIAGYAPVVGKDVKFLLLGDSTVGQEALLRFYVLHVAVLPVVLTLLVTIHFWRIRKDGGLARPAEEDDAPASGDVAIVSAPAVVMATSAGAAAAARPLIDKRNYGIQGLVRGPLTKVGNVADRFRFSWPDLFQAELLVFVITVAGILVVSLFFNAPLEEPVNMMHPPNPAKAPWYFLGLQEMVSYSAFWGGVGIPDARGADPAARAVYRSQDCWSRQVVCQGAAAGQFAIHDLRGGQRNPDDHRHILPRSQLGVRLAMVIDLVTEMMRRIS